MKVLTLTDAISEELYKVLISKGYTANERKQYISFDKGRSDKTYIHYSNNIIRARKNTEGETIITTRFGKPNGKASASQHDYLSTWFFNGYTGKKGSSL
ncbi:hypothetical protein C9J01_19110 [Photobacterium rosenbergii]|uniref:Uncharacterized protein n=1 Tax=Photobacterium rosenbergii TaxID=294936 RepID=A0A2T3N9V6_9GAMM|nr:hypothetical protein [Photobacterium rosenbergii]PSW10319.1 hypothetical protein C9J01_19110 [Photobacterium rosenbergii]